MPQTQYLTLNQFAVETHRGTRYIKSLTDNGVLTTTVIDGRVYYLQSEVDKARQVKTPTQAEELATLKKAFVEFINLTKGKFKIQAEEIEDLKIKMLGVKWDIDILNNTSRSAATNPVQNTVTPATPTEPVLPDNLLEAKQALIAHQHHVDQLEKAAAEKARKDKIEMDLAKKIEASKITTQTKLNSTLKGQKQQDEDAAKQVRLAHRANLAELNRTYVATPTQLEEAHHFLNVYLKDDGKLYYINDPEGNYSILYGCHDLLTTNRAYHEYIKKEYQHLYHLTESGIVDLVTGHSSILDFVPTLHFVTGVPVNSETRDNSHTINIPSNSSDTTEAYPAAWYKFIEDHPQPYQHDHNPPDIDLSYTDLLDVTNPADADAYAAAQSVHQQQINKWVRFRQEQGLL